MRLQVTSDFGTEDKGNRGMQSCAAVCSTLALANSIGLIVYQQLPHGLSKYLYLVPRPWTEPATLLPTQVALGIPTPGDETQVSSTLGKGSTPNIIAQKILLL